jgi:hypothetical protein
MNKCCDDRREHNRAEALKEIPPVSLVCGGRFSWQEEKHFEMLLNEVPDEYKINYMFEVLSHLVSITSAILSLLYCSISI